MAEIIPSLTREVLKRMTSGEKRFAQRLKDLLEDDYLCWYDIPVGRQRRYPDFIILHPSRGLLFLEVKDWKHTSIRKVSMERVELQTEQGLKIEANPFIQVRNCAHVAINKLARDPQLCQNSSRYKGKLATPYGWGVVFTNITRQQMSNGIPDEYRERLLPDHLMIYKDEMTESADAEAFQERLWGMFQYDFPKKLSLPQIDRIRWHLFPEIRINHSQDDLFTTDNDAISDAQPSEVLPDIVRIMDVQQEQLARSLGEGHRVIHGVAGSGKTLILGFRAQLLAQTSHKPILILCFNITLAAKLRSFIASHGIDAQVQVGHFHDWCGTQLKTYGVNVLSGTEPYWERQVLSVMDAVERGHIPRAQYGAVLIDEGHDFESEWLKLIVQMIDPDTNSLLLLYDDAQSIYHKKSGLDFSLSSVGIQAKGRTTILKLNYRNTREILDFAYRFAGDYFASCDSDDDHIPLVKPEAAGTSGPAPLTRHFGHWQEEVSYTLQCLLAWKEQGLDWRDMAIVYMAGYQGGHIAKQLQQAQIPHLWMGTKEYKQAYDPGVDRVTVLTAHSSKGLEFQAVIMVGVGQLNNEDIAQDARLLYVGMTRAQQQLHVVSSGSSPLCERIQGMTG